MTTRHRVLPSLQPPDSSAATALHQRGQPLEELWPYDGARDDTNPSYAPPPEAIADDACFKRGLWRVDATIKEIKHRLVAGESVALGLEIGYGFVISTDGTIPLPGPGEQLTDGHAVLVVGYEDAQAGGCLIFRNSWGADWGDGGYGYLPYSYIQHHGGEAWIIEPNAAAP